MNNTEDQFDDSPDEKAKKNVKDFAEELADKFRLQMERLKLAPEQVYQIHHNIRRMTNQFDTPGPEMRRVVDFNVPNGEFPVPVR